MGPASAVQIVASAAELLWLDKNIATIRCDFGWWIKVSFVHTSSTGSCLGAKEYTPSPSAHAFSSQACTCIYIHLQIRVFTFFETTSTHMYLHEHSIHMPVIYFYSNIIDRYCFP